MGDFRLGMFKLEHDLCQKAQQRAIYTEDISKVEWLIEEYKRVYRQQLQDCNEIKRLFRVETALKDYCQHGDFEKACKASGV